MIIVMRAGVHASDKEVTDITHICIMARKSENDLTVEIISDERVKVRLSNRGVRHIPCHWFRDLAGVEEVILELTDFPRLGTETLESLKKRLGISAALNAV